ncbi:NO-inducible flavohemoprotein [Vibrio scophthalmi]|uniref:Flavohemoprotein n=1 Tax=Vibrio scophthalmi LMG 19158 TaxID=870967 RepID=F9RSV1_9VIBR|nr:NO-inducible flavohemoprotein [Vibrio scophthalmi]EGU31651.1 nitric oxide dioxygenase [Vibrio scophthalmi LMG 19158]
MLNDHHIAVVKSTIPLLETAGPALTQHFYQRMFLHNPELKDIFNMTHQQTGRQSVALFEAVAAYAKNIDNLAALSQAVERIAHKHTSFNIQPQHYQIVGHHLIETLRELASDAFTTEVEEAWTQAYLFLANIFIEREEQIYQLNAQGAGGWREGREFIIDRKTPESQRVTSFELRPADDKPVLNYLAGQYLGIEVKPSSSENTEIRQYSLSQAPNGISYRISVKREGDEHKGLVSHYLHDELEVGDSVTLYPPAGDFFYQPTEKPVVLIAAGVGATPIQAMAHTLSQQKKVNVSYFYACEDADQHTFRVESAQLIEANQWQQKVWYRDQDGMMDLASIAEKIPVSDGEFYLCGPLAFMEHAVQQLEALEVPREQIHYEVFGPHRYL